MTTRKSSIPGSFAHESIGTAGSTGAPGAAGTPGAAGADGDGRLSKDQNTQTLTNNTLANLSGITLGASSNYEVFVYDLAAGQVAGCSFTTDGANAVIAGTFSVYPGCNLQDTLETAAKFSANLLPWGMALNSGAVAVKQITGSSANIRWQARRAAAS